jgi:hypothetical protein
MEIAITTLLTLIEGLLPELGVSSSSVVEKILAALVSIVPIIISDATGLIQQVQGIISTLQSSGNLTTAQLAQLDTLSAQADAAFDAVYGPAATTAPSSSP